MTQNNNKINYLSMFSGIGGFELGIQNSRYGEKLNCIGFMEIDKYAKNIYRQHYPNHTDYGDATKIDPKDLPAIDFLVGGFPCQAFSVAGKRRGFDDTRGTLFFEIARVLKEKKPRYFLLENVKGLLSHDKGRTFQTMLGVLSDLGYDVQWEVFNSKNHGVPQNRERIYIKGFLREKCGQEILSLRKTNPKINAGQGETGKTLPEQIKVGNLYESGHDNGDIFHEKGISHTLTCSNSDETWIATNHNDNIIRLDENKKVNGRDKEECRLYHPDGVTPTLTATHGGSINIVECRGSTQKHASRTDGTYSPTLTQAMGDGGGHVSMVTIQEDTSNSEDPKIQIVGNVSKNGKAQGGHVYSEEGLSPTLIAGQHKASTKIMTKKDDDNPRINIVGNTSPSGHHNGNVYSDEGLVRTICARDYKDPAKVLIRNNTKKGYLEAVDGDGIELAQYNARGKVQPQSTPTLNTGGNVGVLIKDNTKEGYSTAQQGDSIQLGHNNMNGPRVMKEQSPTLTQECNRIGTISAEYIIRKLTPVECERLQGFPKIEKEVEVWWSDQVKKDVLNVMEKWLKNQKSVGNVEKTKLLESVRYVEKSSHPKNQKNKKPVPKNVHINLEEKKVQLLNHEKSSSNVKIVDKKNLYLPHIKQEDFVQQVVFMNSILDQIILHGKEELLQNELYSIHQKNGKIIVNLFGGEITPPVSCVETVTTILEKLMKSITSSHLDSEITVMTIQTWFYYVILVISGYIQKEMNINSLDYFKLSDKTGWTEYGYDGSPISNTQRYKCCGNAVTTNVVTFIMNTWDMKWT